MRFLNLFSILISNIGLLVFYYDENVNIINLQMKIYITVCVFKFKIFQNLKNSSIDKKNTQRILMFKFQTRSIFLIFLCFFKFY